MPISTDKPKTTWVHVATEGRSRRYKYEPIEEARLEVEETHPEKAVHAAVKKYTKLWGFRRRFFPVEDHKIVAQANAWGYDGAWMNFDGFVLFTGLNPPRNEPDPAYAYWMHEGEKDRKTETKEAKPMKMRTAEQLMALYGRNCYLIVTGSKGDMPTLEGKSEREAIQDYERRKSARAYATIVCIPGPKGRTCVRGWIDRSRYRWDDDPESLRVVALRPSESREPQALMATMDFLVKDVVITDPCYLVRDELWRELCRTKLDNARITPTRVEVGSVKMILADTIYGDWMCALEGKSSGEDHEFGKFTADAGMVCAATLGKADTAKVLSRLPKHCYAIIPAFTGRVTITHKYGVCVVSGTGRSNGRDVAFTSRQIA